MEFIFNINSMKKGSHSKRPSPLVVPKQLVLEAEQRAKLQELIEQKAPGVIDMLELHNDVDRSAFLHNNGLDLPQNHPLCKWATQHSIPTRIIRQCQGGIYRPGHHRTKGTHVSTAKHPFVRCHAFVILTYRNDKLAYFQGYLQHLEACALSGPCRLPSFPLNATVLRMAEGELQNDASTARILALNRNYVDTHFNGDALVGNERVLLRSKDITNILRSMKMTKLTINTRKTVQSNLERLLGENASETNIKTAKIHFKARYHEDDRLELILSTPDQQAAAWKYGHLRWIHLDGTFGVCKHKILLFIFMTVDENNKGIPIAYILFTPPPSNKHTAAGYNTEILTHMFTIFKKRITEIRIQNINNPDLEEFCPLVAITDTDYKERGALTTVWPGIRLLLCYFHIRQCWANEMTKKLGRDGDSVVIRQRQILRTHLNMVMEAAYKMEKEPQEVRMHIHLRKEALQQHMVDQKEARVPADVISILNGGIGFLTYIQDTWMGPLLESWCFQGRADAATTLKIPLAKLPTTNNHLEGGNSLLKTQLIPELQRGGRLLRLDELAVVLVRRITPLILGHIRLEARYAEQLALRRQEYGIAVPIDRSIIEREFPQVAYLDNSKNRAAGAKRLIDQSRIKGFQSMDERLYVSVESEKPSKPGHHYQVCVRGQVPEDIRCECLDFLSKGGACKHLRAAAIYINSLREKDQRLPEIMFVDKQRAYLIRRTLPRVPTYVQANATLEANFQADVDDDCDNVDDADDADSMDGLESEFEEELKVNNEQQEEANLCSTMSDTSNIQNSYIIELETLNNSTAPESGSNHQYCAYESLEKQNATAVREQHLTDLRISTSSSLHQLRVNLRAFQKIGAPETASLISHLKSFIETDSYEEAIAEVSKLGPNCKRTSEVSGVYPLSPEKKQRRRESYLSH